MITVDELISKGDWRKTYHEMVKMRETTDILTKGEIQQIARWRQEEHGVPYQDTVRELNEKNQELREEIQEFSRGVIQLSVDSFNRDGYTLEEAQNAV